MGQPYLIAQPDGSRWPWGWGALMVDTAPLDWRCPGCGAKARSRKPENGLGRHWYLFGPARCTACARAWCEANWAQTGHDVHEAPEVREDPDGQLLLPGV